LRLRNKNGLGVIALQGDLRAEAIQPNQAWIDGWNLDSARDRIVGVGDFDGNGRDGFVVTSDWGIGILGHDGKRWRQSVGAPRNTWFGGWRWDATVNAKRDEVRAVANFAGSSAAEILVTSDWGMGVLRKTGDTMQATRTYTRGDRIGSWAYDPANRIMATGDFDGDGCHEVLLFSPWGAGALSMHRNTHLAMHANGERLDGWALDVGNNVIRATGDFDGDERDELLVSSP
ncbi:MAG: hypothetical protein KC457_35665, partial [Myxococcales bacterium]|nr:hypothetical protein [Myxococcales bacterium]